MLKELNDRIQVVCIKSFNFVVCLNNKSSGGKGTITSIEQLKISVTLKCCWWRWKLIQPLWKPVSHYSLKWNILIFYNPAILLVGIYPT